MRVRVVTATAVAALLFAYPAGSASTQTTTVSCGQVWTGFNVQLVGDRDWGWNLGGLGAVGVPKKRAVIVVWSLGGKLGGGLNVYGWASARRSRPSPRCSPVKRTLGPPSLSGLGAITRVRDGWAFGRKFGCLERGRLLVTTTHSGGKARVVVRMQSSGRVMAVGELGNGGGWIRGSRRCEAEEK